MIPDEAKKEILEYISQDHHSKEELLGFATVISEKYDCDARECQGWALAQIKSEKKVETNNGGLPSIQINNRQLRDKMADVVSAINRNNDPPNIFLYNGKLARIVPLEEGISIQIHGEYTFRAYITNIADFIKVTTKELKGEKTNVTISVSPPKELNEAILAKGFYSGIPVLKGTKTTPIMHDDGSIFDKNGYDPTSRYFCKLPDGFKLPRIPDEPSEEDVFEAIGHLADIFFEFPFSNPASRCNFLAMIFTWLFRHLIHGLTPIGVISKNIQGIGGGLLIDCASCIVTGHKAISLGLGRDDERLETIMETSVMSGNMDIIFDNVDVPIESAVLARWNTLSLIPIRRMRQNEEQTIIKNEIVWLANGVNIEIKKHLQRRVYLSTLESDKPKPWETSNFCNYSASI